MGAIAGSTGGNAGAQSIPTAVAEKGVTPAIVDSPTLLMEAARRSDPDLIRVLAAAGADVNQRLEDGTTALMIAVSDTNKDRWAIVKALIEAGADVNAVSKKGNTPLILAAGTYRQSPNLVKALIEAGADVNAVSNDGATPLMMAVKYNSLEVVKMLLEAGARPNAR